MGRRSLPSQAAAKLGTKGGKAGTGEAKVRGDRAHYQAMIQKRWAKHREAKKAEAK
jgi:hypothetical protein